MRGLIAVLVIAVFLTAACASQPPEKGVDKEGVRQRAGEAGQKLNKEELR